MSIHCANSFEYNFRNLQFECVSTDRVSKNILKAFMSTEIIEQNLLLKWREERKKNPFLFNLTINFTMDFAMKISTVFVIQEIYC